MLILRKSLCHSQANSFQVASKDHSFLGLNLLFSSKTIQTRDNKTLAVKPVNALRIQAALPLKCFCARVGKDFGPDGNKCLSENICPLFPYFRNCSSESSDKLLKKCG